MKSLLAIVKLHTKFVFARLEDALHKNILLQNAKEISLQVVEEMIDSYTLVPIAKLPFSSISGVAMGQY